MTYSLVDITQSAYLILADQITQQTLADRQGLTIASAFAEGSVEVPTVAGQLAKLDELLAEPPKPDTPIRRVEKYLGVGNGG